MKRTLRIALPVLALIVVALVAAPFLIPLERFRGPIERAASEATGREVQIAGALRFTLYPDIGVGVENVTVSNVGNARDPVMVSVANAVIGAKLIPLLSRRLEVTQITLQEPVIHLEIAANGSNNWTFNKTEQTPPPAEEPGSMPLEIGTLNVAIEDGLVTYYDARDGRDERFEDIDVTLEREGAGQALAMSGNLTRKDQRLTLSASIADPDALVDARDTQTTISLASNILNANFTGTMGATGNIAGALKLGARSLRDLGTWAGISLPGENGLGLFALEGMVSADRGNYALSDIVMSFDAMRFTGDLGLDTRQDVPKLSGQLSVDKLDLNPYLGGPSPEQQAQPAPAQTVGWSDDPISLAGLKAMDADLTLNVSGLALRAFKIDAGTIGVTLKGGVLDAALRSIALYGGTGSGALTVNASGATPSFRNTLDVSGVRVQALLTDLLGVDRIEGTGSMRYSVTSQGASQKAIIEALSGDARINFTDGRIRGVDLAQVARLVQSVISGQGLGNAVGGAASTDFAELGGSFTIRNGVMHNEDFRLLNPFVRMTGAGDVNLAARTMDFRLEARAVASAQGQGGQLGAAGIGVPFRVSGPWTDLSYAPDLAGVTRGLAEGLLQGQSPLDALTGRQQQDGNTSSSPAPAAPVQDLLKGLLGR